MAITAIHNVKGTGLEDDPVENVDIVNFAVSNNNNGWNAASQVEQRMEFYGTFSLSKYGPGEERKAQIDGRRVECINGLFEFDAKVVVYVKRSGDANQGMGEVPVNTPIAN